MLLLTKQGTTYEKESRIVSCRNNRQEYANLCCKISYSFPAKVYLLSLHNASYQLGLLCPLVQIKYFKNTTFPGGVWNHDSATFLVIVRKEGFGVSLFPHAKGLLL